MYYQISAKVHSGTSNIHVFRFSKLDKHSNTCFHRKLANIQAVDHHKHWHRVTILELPTTTCEHTQHIDKLNVPAARELLDHFFGGQKRRNTDAQFESKTCLSIKETWCTCGSSCFAGRILCNGCPKRRGNGRELRQHAVNSKLFRVAQIAEATAFFSQVLRESVRLAEWVAGGL